MALEEMRAPLELWGIQGPWVMLVPKVSRDLLEVRELMATRAAKVQPEARVNAVIKEPRAHKEQPELRV